MVQRSDPQNSALLERFRQAVGEDLRLLALLHDREPDKDTLAALRAGPVAQQLGLRLRSDAAREGIRLLDEALAGLPEPVDTASLDLLAAAYADVYLTHAYRAAPCESVWLDDDSLARQEPMFQVRDWYRRQGLVVADADKRPDDHLVFQLGFLAHLLESSAGSQGLRDAARFMDGHLLRWLGLFCGRVAARCPNAYFVGLMLLTGAYGEELRDLIAGILKEPRPTPEPPARSSARPRQPVAAPQPYVPGRSPGW